MMSLAALLFANRRPAPDARPGRNAGVKHGERFNRRPDQFKPGRHGPAVGMVLRRLCRPIGSLLALGLMVGNASAEPGGVPRPHGYPLSEPPGNVAADHYPDLFGGVVFVGFAGGVDDFPGHPDDTIEVFHTGRDGRFAVCFFGPPGRHHAKGDWRWKMDRGGLPADTGRTPLLVNGPDIGGNNGAILMPVYDSQTGGMDWYTPVLEYWFGHAHGHLQKRLPRAVWKACPDFPGASALGVGVNEKQTAITYFDLVKQDRGQRIMRPDLVTGNPTECRDPQTGQWEVCGRRDDQ